MQKYTVYIIDNDKNHSKSLKIELENRGFHVLIFNSAKTALDKLKLSSQNEGIIITDIEFRGMQNKKFFDELHRIIKNPKLLVFSSSDKIGDQLRALSIFKADMFIEKSSGIHAICDYVNDLFNVINERKKIIQKTISDLSECLSKTLH